MQTCNQISYQGSSHQYFVVPVRSKKLTNTGMNTFLDKRPVAQTETESSNSGADLGKQCELPAGFTENLKPTMNMKKAEKHISYGQIKNRKLCPENLYRKL